MFKLNKKFLLAVVVFNIITLTIVGCSKKSTESEENIVAKVNGEVITQEEFDREFNMVKRMYEQQLGEDALSQETENDSTLEDLLKESMLNEIILEKLVFQNAKEIGIVVSEEELDIQLQSNIEALGGAESYKNFLEHNDFTDELYQADLKKKILYEKHAEDFISKAELSEEEIKEYYEENKDALVKVRASHILVQTEEEGMEVLKKLEAGEEFESLAVTESKDEESAVRGGDLGYFTREVNLGEEFTNAAFDLKSGEISQLVQTDLGYHIILLEDRLDSYEDLKDDASKIIKNDKYISTVSKLMDDAEIEIFMEKDKKAKKAKKEKDKE